MGPGGVLPTSSPKESSMVCINPKVLGILNEVNEKTAKKISRGIKKTGQKSFRKTVKKINKPGLLQIGKISVLFLTRIITKFSISKNNSYANFFKRRRQIRFRASHATCPIFPLLESLLFLSNCLKILFHTQQELLLAICQHKSTEIKMATTIFLT